MHYWYDNRLDADCQLFFPAFFMYDQGQLAGFGWDLAGRYDFTQRVEYPSLPIFNVSENEILLFEQNFFFLFEALFETCSSMFFISL